MAKFQTFSRCMKPLHWESTELGSEMYLVWSCYLPIPSQRERKKKENDSEGGREVGREGKKIERRGGGDMDG